MTPNLNAAYSATVRMRLFLNGSEFSITHMGGDFIIVKEPKASPPAEAKITLCIDDVEHRWEVSLPNGIQPEQIKIPVMRIN